MFRECSRFQVQRTKEHYLSSRSDRREGNSGQPGERAVVLWEAHRELDYHAIPIACEASHVWIAEITYVAWTYRTGFRYRGYRLFWSPKRARRDEHVHPH